MDDESLKDYIREGAISRVTSDIIINDYVFENYFSNESPRIIINIFISSDGAFLMREHKKLKDGKGVSKNEIAVFLEIPTGDILSGQVMHVLMGNYISGSTASNVLANRQLYNDLYDSQLINSYESVAVTDEQIIKLLGQIDSEDSFLSTLITYTLNALTVAEEAVSDAGIWVFEKLGSIVSSLRIPEKFWNIESKEYVLKGFDDLILESLQSFKTALLDFRKQYDYIIPDWTDNLISVLLDAVTWVYEFIIVHLKAAFAFNSGLWNGLIDLVTGIFFLVELFFKLMGSKAGFVKDIRYYSSLFLEFADNIIQAVKSIDFSELISDVKDMSTALFEAIKKAEFNSPKINFKFKLNYTEVAYYTGYIAFQILEFIVPILKVAKVSKVKGFTAASKQKATTQAKIKYRNFADFFFKLFDDFVALLRRGNKGIREYIQKAFKEIVAWLEKKLGVKLEMIFTKSASVKNLQKLYGKNFAKVGAKSTLKKYNDELAILVKNAESAPQISIFKKAFEKSKAKLGKEA